jgi:hypothetical protein
MMNKQTTRAYCALVLIALAVMCIMIMLEPYIVR